MKSTNIKSVPPRLELVSVTKALCGMLPTYMAALQEAFGETAYPSEEFITRLLDDANQVEALPQPATRRSQRVQTRNDMVEMIPLILSDANFLEQYILAAYPAKDVDVMIAATTIPTNRNKTRNFHWASAIAMLVGMKDFIETNRTTLTEQGGMPASFEEQVGTHYTEFSALQTALSTTNINSLNETDTVETETYNLYQRVLAVLANLRAIYYTDRAMREQFSYAAIKSKAILGAPAAGFRGQLVDAETELPIEAATLQMDYHDRQAVTTSNGRFEMTRLSEGTYSVQITAEGYAPLLLEGIEVQKSIVTNLKPVALLPLQATVPVAESDSVELVEGASESEVGEAA